MKIQNLHPWQVTPKEARRIQAALRNQVVEAPLTNPISLVAGADVAYDKKTNQCFASVVVFSYPELKLLEAAKAQITSTFPYVPGLLTFREGPALVKAFKALKTLPQLVLFDGQGRAHPNFFGLASHMGVILDLPAIGCAKSRLVGEYDENALGEEKGSWVPLIYKEQRVGVVLRTRRGVSPVFVSVGHKINLKTAMALVLSSCGRYRLPEPLRRAHQETVKFRKNP